MGEKQGTFKLTPGDTASEVRITWQLDGGASTAEEQRTLKWDGETATPEELIAAFESAGDAQEMQEVGFALWDCIGNGKAGQEWKSDRATVPPGQLMRTIIDGTDLPPSWQAVPWETLSEGNGHLTLVPQQPFVRFFARKPGVHAEGWPTRILIVCGEGPESADDKINVQRELEAIEDGMWERRREIIYKVLDRPDAAELRAAMQNFQPHVLHFIGHGNGQALIINAPPAPAVAGGKAGQKWEADAAQIRSWVDQGNSPTPFLVFLNACRSETTADGEKVMQSMSHQSFRSLTDAFLSAGVRAVIGMAGDVEGDAAQIFSRVFYQEWFGGEPLDVAITRARADVNAAWSANNVRQAFLACLTTACPPTSWLRWRPMSGALKQELKNPILLRIQKTFVDRNRVRAAIFDEWLKPDKQWLKTPGAGGILVVAGDGQSGKTDAVRLVFKAMLTNEWIARWQEMCVQTPSQLSVANWLEVLKMFASGTNLCGVLSGPLSLPEFAPFLAKLKSSAIEPNTEEEIDDVFKVWRSCIENVAQTKPVALAFDKLTNSAPIRQSDGSVALPAYLEHLTERLFAPWFNPASPEPSSRIFVVLVMNQNEAAAYIPLLEGMIGRAIRIIRVANIDPDEASRAMRQYFRQQLQDDQYAQRLDQTKITHIHKICESHVQHLDTIFSAALQVGALKKRFAEFFGLLEEANLAQK